MDGCVAHLSSYGKNKRSNVDQKKRKCLARLSWLCSVFVLFFSVPFVCGFFSCMFFMGLFKSFLNFDPPTFLSRWSACSSFI